MSEPFASIGDLQGRWPSFPAGQEGYATTLLGDVSAMVRESWPDVDDRIAAGTLQPDSVVRVVCQVVKRAMRNEDKDGVESDTTAAGTLSDTRKYSNPDGNLYFTKAERDVLDGPGARSGRAFALDLSSDTPPAWLC